MLLLAYAITLGTCAMTLAAAINQRERAESERLLEADARTRLERKMNQAQRLEGLGSLAGGVAHDFNNILTIIRGNAELIALKIDDRAHVSERLESIEHAADRAADLCRRLLTYAGRRRPTQQRVILSAIVEDTLGMLRPSISKKVNLRTVVQGPSPEIGGDETLLRQVLMNLVLNGAEAIADEEGSVEVRIGTQELSAQELEGMLSAGDARPQTYAFLEVTDTGSGMDVETAERMFDPFFTTKTEGRGLGLAAVMGILQSHAGAIFVRGIPGVGTTIRVYLPALEA